MSADVEDSDRSFRLFLLVVIPAGLPASPADEEDVDPLLLLASSSNFFAIVAILESY